MKFSSEIITGSAAVILVAFITFIPHELQTYLINTIEQLLNALFNVFLPSSSLFDTRIFVSNLGHLLVFCILGFTAGRFGKRYSVFTLMTVLVIIAITSELAQFFTAGREPSMSDLVINLTAVSAGIMAYLKRNQLKSSSTGPH